MNELVPSSQQAARTDLTDLIISKFSQLGSFVAYGARQVDVGHH